MPHLTLPSGITVSAVDAAQPTARPPILFVHGMFGGAWYFDKFQRCFAERGYSSYALDLRGHHGSRAVADIGNVSVLDYVEDALEVVRAMPRASNGERPIVVGHSMGGLIAQKVAEADAVSAAVLLASAPPRGIRVLSVRLLRLAGTFGVPVLLSRGLYPKPSDADELVFNHIPVAERAGLFARFAPESGRAARELAFSTIPVDARKVRCPVLSIAATDDHMVQPRVGLAIARTYGALYEEFPNQGHFLVWEPGWDAVARQVLSWLDALTLGA
ncbi:MAG TPA: alpha/beta fold hydrolase [Gemmatimonadaceae bacterium]|jgi:pimeloyl-ACP methyl ester carboxylesterase|nr:alpha/beta fold hydrolase [Gemmatimonadaceae bacterium]